MKQYKYKTSFSSVIKKISNLEIDKYISLAGLEKLRPLLPKNINLEESPDLIGVVGNLANGGISNKNGDGITNETAVEIGKNFIWRYINGVHRRGSILGVICNAGFSDFVSNKILTEEEARTQEDPINISIAFVLYKTVVSDKFIELLEESVDETSPNYNNLSLSWELAFDDYDISIGSKIIKDAKIITDTEDKKKYEKYLIANNGNGKDEDGNLINRIIRGSFLIPLGAAIVQNPAGDVKGLYLIDEDKNNEENDKDNKESISKTIITTLNNKITSQIENSNVINNDNIKEKSLSMSKKITKLEELTDETLKECRADNIRELIDEEIKKASEKWVKERDEKSNALVESEKKQKEIIADYTSAKAELETIKKQLEDLKNKAVVQERQEKFNGWMSYFDDKYELEKEDKEILASDLSSVVSDEDFTKYQKKMEILLKSKNKASLAAKKAAEDKEKEDKEKTEKTKESLASTKETNGEKIEAALENGEKGTNLPNGTTVEETLRDKFKKAFSAENMIQGLKKKVTV